MALILGAKMNCTRTFFVILIFLMFGAVSPINAQQDQFVGERLRIVFASRGLDKAIEFYLPPPQTKAFRERGGLGMISLAVRNLTEYPIKLEYKVDWTDNEGFPMNAVAGWQALIMSPNQEVSLRSAAQEQGAYSARLSVRDPQHNQ